MNPCNCTTDYYPVTKEELDMIKNDCAYPDKLYCEGCQYDGNIDNGDLPCKFKGANALMDEVIARPDPLALLEAWHNEQLEKIRKLKNGAVSIVAVQSAIFAHTKSIATIKQLRTNPKAVRDQGEREGWC